ncbi:MAG: hypothetical protein QM803_20775 [Rhodocyclaceae bacterium]
MPLPVASGMPSMLVALELLDDDVETLDALELAELALLELRELTELLEELLLSLLLSSPQAESRATTRASAMPVARRVMMSSSEWWWTTPCGVQETDSSAWRNTSVRGGALYGARPRLLMPRVCARADASSRYVILLNNRYNY